MIQSLKVLLYYPSVGDEALVHGHEGHQLLAEAAARRKTGEVTNQVSVFLLYSGSSGASKKSSTEVWGGGAGKSLPTSESSGGESWRSRGQGVQGGDQPLVGE